MSMTMKKLSTATNVKSSQHDRNINQDHQVLTSNNIRWLESSPSTFVNNKDHKQQKDRIAYEFISSIDRNNKSTTNGSSTIVFFCNGYQSSSLREDGGGSKINAIKKYCLSTQLASFCCFDYRGHGISDGNITEFTLGDWIQDAFEVLEETIKEVNAAASTTNTAIHDDDDTSSHQKTIKIIFAKLIAALLENH